MISPVKTLNQFIFLNIAVNIFCRFLVFLIDSLKLAFCASSDDCRSTRILANVSIPPRLAVVAESSANSQDAGRESDGRRFAHLQRLQNEIRRRREEAEIPAVSPPHALLQMPQRGN